MLGYIFSTVAVLLGLALTASGPYYSIGCIEDNKVDCSLTVSVCFGVSIFGTVIFVYGLIGLYINMFVLIKQNHNKHNGFVVNPYQPIDIMEI